LKEKKRENLLVDSTSNHVLSIFLIAIAIHASNTVHTRTIQIQLEKQGQSYGILLRGGHSDDQTKARPLIVTKIRPRGPADK
jgi:hypothetical protein